VEKIFETTPSTDVVSFSPIRSIFKVPGEGDILIGTQTCEVFTCSSKSVKKLVSGHFKDELWGLAVRPESSLASTQEYCTIGDDGILRVWNLKDHKEVFSKNLGGISRTCCFSPDGFVLAVGFGSGGRGKNKEDGVVKIYRFTEKDRKTVSIEIVNEIKEAKQWISVVKFSPDGLTLAVGSRDNSIYLYSVTQKCKRKGKFSKHKAGINQMDFSSCSKYLQSCCR
jgi:WD40 repeat protein